MLEFKTFFIWAQRIIKGMEERWFFFLIYNEIKSQARAKRPAFNMEKTEAMLFVPT